MPALPRRQELHPREGLRPYPHPPACVTGALGSTGNYTLAQPRVFLYTYSRAAMLCCDRSPRFPGWAQGATSVTFCAGTLMHPPKTAVAYQPPPFPFPPPPAGYAAGRLRAVYAEYHAARLTVECLAAGKRSKPLRPIGAEWAAAKRSGHKGGRRKASVPHKCVWFSRLWPPLHPHPHGDALPRAHAQAAAAHAQVDCRIDTSENTTVKIAFSLINFKLVPAAATAGRSDPDPGCACVRACIYVLSVRGCEAAALYYRVYGMHGSIACALTAPAGAAGAHAMGVGPVGHPEGSGHRRPRQRHACPGRRFRTHRLSHAHTHARASMHVHSMRRKGVRVCLRECLSGCT